VEEIKIPEDLQEKIIEAIKNGNYFITISTKKDKILNHYYKRENFSSDDALPSLGAIQNDFIKQEKVGGWQ